jgi:hypothetical protein
MHKLLHFIENVLVLGVSGTIAQFSFVIFLGALLQKSYGKAVLMATTTIIAAGVFIWWFFW